jgi:hypothetical protein
MVTVYTPPVEGLVPPRTAVPALDLVPGVNFIHAARPDAVTVAFGVPPVVTVNFSFLCAAIVFDEADVMVAVFDEGTTLFEGLDAALVPSALVAVTVKV